MTEFIYVILVPGPPSSKFGCAAAKMWTFSLLPIEDPPWPAAAGLLPTLKPIQRRLFNLLEAE